MTNNHYYLQRFLKAIDYLVKIPLILIIKGYKKITPAHWSYSCKFVPTCSSYALNALNKKNLFTALYLITKRLIRCNPLSKGGLDEVK
jgi:putative membrane protein insertion efficiency factor